MFSGTDGRGAGSAAPGERIATYPECSACRVTGWLWLFLSAVVKSCLARCGAPLFIGCWRRKAVTHHSRATLSLRPWLMRDGVAAWGLRLTRTDGLAARAQPIDNVRLR
jgi:hypothetical protein